MLITSPKYKNDLRQKYASHFQSSTFYGMSAVTLNMLFFSGNARAYVYIGCFVDSINRDIVGYGPTHQRTMTVEKCYDICEPLYQYFGLQVF